MLECAGGVQNPCNGHGTCNTDATCTCSDGWAGEGCNEVWLWLILACVCACLCVCEHECVYVYVCYVFVSCVHACQHACWKNACTQGTMYEYVYIYAFV
jgi:hypothetical protein